MFLLIILTIYEKDLILPNLILLNIKKKIKRIKKGLAGELILKWHFQNLRPLTPVYLDCDTLYIILAKC